jgi:uncharacterized protein (DUF305 family)
VVFGAVAVAVAAWTVGRRSATEPALPGASSVDVGFLRDMADHHDQAVQMAVTLLPNSDDAVLRGFAVDTVASQRYEIGLMDARLQEWGLGRGAVDRKAMVWMGAPTSVARMPGMASVAELTELTRLRGREADLLFVRLMTDHHQGGIHMATHAMRHARTAGVRDLAERIAKSQRIEIRDLELSRVRLGGEPAASHAGHGP